MEELETNIRDVIIPYQSVEPLVGGIAKLARAYANKQVVAELEMWHKLDPGQKDEVHCTCLPWVHDQMNSRIKELTDQVEKK
jgi:hypothetical protein